MTTPSLPQKRVRINVATSVKGVKTWDCTVEYYDWPEDRAGVLDFTLAESDRLVAELDKRYPKEV